MIFNRKKVVLGGTDIAFSSIDFVGQCLVDTVRTQLFKKLIQKSVKRRDVVVDLGSGSGILSLFAHKSAKKVYAVEFDPYVASVAETNFKLNKANNISLLVVDARKVTFDGVKEFDVVISELLTTGIVDEHQVQAINNLHEQGLINDSTKFIPERQDTYICLVNVNSKFFGVDISMVLHLWKWHDWSHLSLKKLSTTTLLSSVDFRYKNDEYVDVEVVLEVVRSGILNGIYLTSQSVFNSKDHLDDTEALNAPMFVPVKSRYLKKGQKIRTRVTYKYGGGYGTFTAGFQKLNHSSK